MWVRRLVVLALAATVVGVSGCSAVREQIEEVNTWNAWVDRANATMTELNDSTELDAALEARDRTAIAAELREMAAQYTSIADGPDAELNTCFLTMAELSEDLAVTVEEKKNPAAWVEGAGKLDAQQALCNARVDVLNAENGATAPG
jgi:uncharacterized protein YceK